MKAVVRFCFLCLVLAGGSAGANSVDGDPERQIVVTVANPARPGIGGAASTWKGWSWTGGYRVSVDALATARELADDYGLQKVDAWPISVLDVYCLVYRIGSSDKRDDVIAAMRKDDRVSLAQPMQIFSTTTPVSADLPPGDPYAGLQHGLVELALADLHSIATGRGVRVAVIDTGAQLEHPDIASRVAGYADFVKRSGDDFADDVHGTAIAGIIAATAGNHEGILGVAPESDLLILKACWPVREGIAAAHCNSFTIARAVVAAREMKADIVNLSLAGPSDSLLEQLLDAVIGDGLIVIGAEPEDAYLHYFPTSVGGVIAVRAYDRAIREGSISVPAPGTDIITTVPQAEYQYVSGNSVAVAHVSGVAALLRQLDTGMEPARLARILLEAVPREEGVQHSLNACRAIASLDKKLVCKKT